MTVATGVGAAGWRLFHYPVADSTNDVARGLHPWDAVRADHQRAGRGRFGRKFVSDPGGLWISAILPAEGGPKKWAGFSLMVGLHLLKMIEAIPVPGARLRWPNDLMIGRKKLGGLLIEQSAPHSITVGFGLNVANTPWIDDPSLAPVSTSLAREISRPPNLEEMAVRTLNALADAHLEMSAEGKESAIRQLNHRWSDSPLVRIELSGGGMAFGRFAGLDPQGNLRLFDDSNYENLVEHQSVERLIEVY